MTENLKFNVGASVTMFRLRAQRLFAVWAHAWTTIVIGEPASRDAVETLCSIIQDEYCTVLHRNPTVHEWVRDYLTYRQRHTPRISIIADLMSRRPSSVEPFNPAKPWWMRLQVAGRDEHVALQTFSEDVGRAFLHLGGKTAVLSSDVDWTDEQNITDFLQNLPKPLKTKPFWRFWKK